jgi:hypothetical protein
MQNPYLAERPRRQFEAFAGPGVRFPALPVTGWHLCALFAQGLQSLGENIIDALESAALHFFANKAFKFRGANFNGHAALFSSFSLEHPGRTVTFSGGRPVALRTAGDRRDHTRLKFPLY